MSLKILAFALTAAFAGSLAFASESTETRAPKRYRQAPQAQQQPEGDYQDYDQQDYQGQGGYAQGGYAQGGVVAGGAVVGGGCCGPAALPAAPIPQVGCCGGYPPPVLPINPGYPVVQPLPVVPLVCTVVRLPAFWQIYQARNGVSMGPVSQGAYIHLGMAIAQFRAQGCVFTNL